MAILSKIKSTALQSTHIFRSSLKYQTIRSTFSNDSKWNGSTNGNEKPMTQNIHVTPSREYPVADHLPLPDNYEDINTTEKSRFSPERNRDISGSFLTSVDSSGTTKHANVTSDPHLKSYDCTGAVSLNSAMQSNVPQPFYTDEDLTNLNMPGGQWGQGHKYMAEELNQSHPINVSRGQVSGAAAELRNHVKKTHSFFNSSVHDIGQNNFLHPTYNVLGQVAFYSSLKKEGESQGTTGAGESTTSGEGAVLSRTDKLKRAVKEYGATVIVFHVTISLISLGGFYLAVTSGIDFTKVLGQWGATEGAKAAETAAPFVVAYAIHKVFAPVRISITLASTPFIVRHLRKIGFLKPPVKK